MPYDPATVRGLFEENRGLELGNAIFGNSRGEFPLNRGTWDKAFQALWAVNDDWCYWEKDTPEFTIFPYWWGDCTCGCPENPDGDEVEDHKATCKLVRPNFVYKPLGLEINWYKYPFRDSYANRKITEAEFEEMLGVLVKTYALLTVAELRGL